MLSELTGAADYLDGAILVNPYDADGLARSLREALDLPDAERRERLGRVQAAVQDLDVHIWAKRFLAELDGAPAPPNATADAGGADPDTVAAEVEGA